MRFIVSLFAVLLTLSGLYAQDGLYGTFLVGQKIVDFGPFNELLKQNFDLEENLFPNSNWTIGGEGHVVINRMFVVGGKAFGISHERVIDHDVQRRVRMTSGMGVGFLGLNIIPENFAGIRLYPNVGAGISSFIIQSKRSLPEERRDFDLVLRTLEDEIVTLGKLGLIIDAGVGFDWYRPFKRFFTFVPGLDLGILVHAQAGYSFLPGDLEWRRDFDMAGQDQVEGGPDLKFDGFYFNLGLGIGLSN